MKVILLENIENIGKKFEVKNVADGYVRNFLIPKNLVKIATEQSIKWLEMQKEIESKKAEEELTLVQGVASSIDGQEIPITMKVGENGQLFESLNTQKIAEKLKEMGFNVKKNQIELKDPIKEIGEYPVKIKLEHNLEAEIKVLITEETK